MSIRVLIVDDEPEIAEGIAFLISRLCPGYETDVAYDGEEGCKYALSKRPDIVLTDIKMPGLDGLEMISRLKEAGLESVFVVLSGFAEFEYAKKAITLGVEEFITKPVEEEELCRVLEKAGRELLRVQETRKLVKDYVLRDFLDHGEKYDGEMEEYLEELGISISDRLFLCIAAEAGAGEDGRQSLRLSPEEEKLMTAGPWQQVLQVEYGGNLTLLIGILKKDEYILNEENVLSCMEELRRRLRRRLKCPVNMGAGGICQRAGGLPQAFEEARCALNYKLLKGADCVILWDQIRSLEGSSSVVLPEDIRRLESCIDRMDDGGSREVIEDIFSKIETCSSLSLQELQMISLNLILTGIRRIPFAQFQINQYLGKNIFSLESISKFQTIEQLKNWIVNILSGMNELMLKNDCTQKRNVVEEAKDYIVQNFNREIGLNEIAERFFINPNYFSQLFKKKTGETYQSYVIRLRIERARKLLAETDRKIYEICGMVGYSDTNHFIKIFTRATGMTPGEYRIKERNNDATI